MKKTSITVAMLIVATTIVFAHQNCSLHQNEGRKFLDSRDSFEPEPDPEPFVQRISNECADMVTDGDLIAVFGEEEDIEASSITDGCQISVGGSGMGTLKFTECTVGAINKDDVAGVVADGANGLDPLPLDNEVECYSGLKPNSTQFECGVDTPGDNFVFIFHAYQTGEGDSTQVRYFIKGARYDVGTQGLVCGFVFAPADYPSLRSGAKSRGHELVDRMSKNIGL